MSRKKKNRDEDQVDRGRSIGGIIALVIFLAVVIGIGSLIMKGINKVNYYKNFNEAYKPGDDTQIEFTIKRGESYNSFAERLMVEGVIEDKDIFIMKTKLLGLGPSYQAGDFVLSPSMTMEEIMAQLQDAHRETVRFTIPEGYTIVQTAEKLAADGFISSPESFYDALENYNSDFHWFLLDLEEQYQDPQKKISAVVNKYEGFLFPDTYEIYKGSGPKIIIGKFFDRFEQIFTDEMKDAMDERGLTVQEVVTIASLIERECRDDAERPLVASVIYNRLEQDMNLELDCAIQYILGDPKVGLTYSDLEIESPYNVYQNKGLPPGPIASPGLASIKAALFPEDTKYLYYVLKSQSAVTHNFAETYKEFLKYKDQYKATP